jgi:Type II intron maturase
MEIGLGNIQPTKIPERSRSVVPMNGATRPNVQPQDPNRPVEPVIYPPHQRSFKCMQCAQFIRLDAGEKVYGRRHGRAVDWAYHDILSYFSRMTEVFGGMWSKRTRYLMKDSLACTLAIKHKLRSRAAAYKKFKGIPEYPVPNELRPKRFQIDQPIPFIHFCTRKRGSCRTMTEEEIRKETERLNKMNVTDHTFQLKRERGERIHRLKPVKSRKRRLGPNGLPLRPPTIVAKHCIVQTVGPLSAVPRFDSKGRELHPKKRIRKSKNTDWVRDS